MRSLLRIGLVACVLVSSAFAGEKGESNQRYIVLATGRTKTIKQELADAATKGYHIVAGDAANNILLLEKGPDSTRGDYVYLDNLFRGMKEAAAQGYRVLPKTLGTSEYSIGAVMEKVAGNEACEYKILDTVRTSSFQKDLSQASSEGWKLVGLQAEDRYFGVMERPAAGAPASSLRAERYLLLTTKRPSTMQKELDDAAGKGYRVTAATAAEEMIIVLEKPGDSPAKTAVQHEYQVLSVARSGTLEKEINDAAARGFHVLPNTMSLFKKESPFSFPSSNELAVIVEKDAGDDKRYEYKLLGTRKVATSEKEMQEDVQQGFTVEGMLLSYQEQLVLLVRPALKP